MLRVKHKSESIFIESMDDGTQHLETSCNKRTSMRVMRETGRVRVRTLRAVYRITASWRKWASIEVFRPETLAKAFQIKISKFPRNFAFEA